MLNDHANIDAGQSQLSTLDQLGENVRNIISRSVTPQPQMDPPKELLGKISASLKSLESLVHAFKAPLPTETGDGSYLKESEDEAKRLLKEVLEDMHELNVDSLETLFEVQAKMLLHETTDDRKYLMERLIQAAITVADNPTGVRITNTFLTTLWSDIKHPPELHLSNESQYRSADGSGNSSIYKDYGAARQPYGRTVPPQSVQPINLPDPGVIFDTLMARKDKGGKDHPTGISSILFYLASIIIHDAFRTDHRDFNQSNTSSYLDLSPLYGSDANEIKKMRTYKDGKIFPDCFSETRLLSFPPGVGALLIMYNRFHNYIVEQLALINENGRFNNEDEIRYDEDLFQTGRLVTCGLYVNTILVDYVRTILNTNKTDTNWLLDPRVDIPGGPVMGVGNQVSAEFNLVYRWHAAVSAKDDKWTQGQFEELFPGRDPSKVPREEFVKVLSALERKLSSQKPYERDFAKLTRQADGTYEDQKLVDILVSGVKDCANAFGPQQVPTVMRAIEVMGIEQARSWNLSSLNEFRKHFGLEPHRTFEHITEVPEVAEALKNLYVHPDNVELYPGLVVEDAKLPMEPGSGLCPSYTVSRAVLSDAVSLVRGDRFYTSSYTPKNLTNFGFSEVAIDSSIDNGCVFYKLFLRAFPNSFKYNSVFVHYPLTIPTEMERVLKRLGKHDMYDYSDPVALPETKTVFSYPAADRVLHNSVDYKIAWGNALEFLMGDPVKTFMLFGDEEPNLKSRALMEKAMYAGAPQDMPSRAIPTGHEQWLKDVRNYYTQITTELLQEKKYKLAGANEVDIIRDVGNMAHVHFCADMFAVPLKTEQNPHGIFTEQQFYLIMAAVFICVFFDADPEHSFPLRQKARDAAQQLGGLLVHEVDFIKRFPHLAEAFQEHLAPGTVNGPMRTYGIHMIQRLLASESDPFKLVWGSIMGTAGGMVANQGQMFSQALDYIFTDGQKHIDDIRYWASQDTEESDDKLMHYILEASRLFGETGVFRWATKDEEIDDPLPGVPDHKVSIKKGDRIMVVLKSASRDPTVFPNPDQLDLTRPLDSYIGLGHGRHQCLGLPMVRVALAAMLKVIFRLPRLRLANVYRGGKVQPSEIKKVKKMFAPGDQLPDAWHYHAYLTEDWDSYFPFPTSLKVNFDDEEVHVNGHS